MENEIREKVGKKMLYLMLHAFIWNKFVKYGVDESHLMKNIAEIISRDKYTIIFMTRAVWQVNSSGQKCSLV